MKKINKPEVAPEPGRRLALKTAVLGGAAVAVTPEKWTRPIVDSVMLPAHATTTDQVASDPVTLLTPQQGTAYLDIDETFPPEQPEAESEAAAQATAQAIDLGEILVPSAHAALSLSFNTKYFLRNLGSDNYQFTRFRTFDTSEKYFPPNHYWASGTLKLGQIIEVPTFKNCGGQRLYTADIKLASVTGSQAVIEVYFLGALVYSRTIPFVPNASPSTCSG